MADTSIDWADKVWNPVTGCTKVSEGCHNCYAERMAKRWQRAGVCGYKDGFAVTCHPERLSHPRTWRKPKRIFVNSMGDLFHDSVPLSFLTEVMQAMDRAKHHTFLVLTKRPEAMRDYLQTVAAIGGGEPPAHIWWGVSVEDQQSADERIPLLLQTPAAVRFVSVEPMLGPVNIFNSVDGVFGTLKHPAAIGNLHWVICGGETGHGARPLHPDWVRSLRDQCQSTAVPFFFKSWGEWAPYDGAAFDVDDDSEQTRFRHMNWDGEKYEDVGYPGWSDFLDYWCVEDCTVRVGKKASGRMLDGTEWLEAPC